MPEIRDTCGDCVKHKTDECWDKYRQASAADRLSCTAFVPKVAAEPAKNGSIWWRPADDAIGRPGRLVVILHKWPTKGTIRGDWQTGQWLVGPDGLHGCGIVPVTESQIRSERWEYRGTVLPWQDTRARCTENDTPMKIEPITPIPLSAEVVRCMDLMRRHMGEIASLRAGSPPYPNPLTDAERAEMAAWYVEDED